jgi:hypothetical protein
LARSREAPILSSWILAGGECGAQGVRFCQQSGEAGGILRARGVGVVFPVDSKAMAAALIQDWTKEARLAGPAAAEKCVDQASLR